MFTPRHVSCVMCQVSRVTCHVSHDTFFFKLFLSNIFLLSGGASRWRVCYQQGLPRLVLTINGIVIDEKKVCLHHFGSRYKPTTYKRVHSMILDPLEVGVAPEICSCIFGTVSVLGWEEGYTVKYIPLPEGVPKGEAWGSSWRQRGIFERISQAES